MLCCHLAAALESTSGEGGVLFVFPRTPGMLALGILEHVRKKKSVDAAERWHCHLRLSPRHLQMEVLKTIL
jgi:flavin-dependent dehydrogenase